MEHLPLLQTKLFIPPVRGDLVSRPRLIERLNAGLHSQLSLISAPAGFGKTTLLSEWVRHVGAHCDAPQDAPQIAWLSLDEGDNDAARFLSYVIAALRRTEPDLASGVWSDLQSHQPPPPTAILSALINDLTVLPGSRILVLDDYHLIEPQEIHDALAFLLEHLPPQLHLVIATREDPQLPLARLRARGQLVELRAAALRFTSSEAAAFLNQAMGLDLSAEDIAALEARTEGWIAGLHLAALSIQGRGDSAGLIESFTGSHRFVLDYLFEEVLQKQSASIQEFLLHTSVLDRLTGPLCDAVRFGSAESPSTLSGDAVRFGSAESVGSSKGTGITGQDDGRETLATLDRGNLFIVPLDQERRWYRYHHLFADLLRQRLRRLQPELVPTLHRRASEWYEQNGFPEQAAEHALQAEDHERAACLIDEQAEAMWLRGEHVKLQRWLSKLPDKVVFSRPQLCIFDAWYLFASGRQEAAEQMLQACEQRFEPAAAGSTENPPPNRYAQMSDAEMMKLKGMATVIRAFMATYLGDVEAMALHGQQALAYLPKEELIWRSNAAIALGDSQGFRGDVDAAYQSRLQAAEEAAQAGETLFSTMAYMKAAVALREQGRLRETITVCQREIQGTDSSGLPRGSVVGALLAIWAETLAEMGNLEEALDLANQGVALTERGIDLAMRGWSYLCTSRILFSAGDLDGAERIFQRVESTARDTNLPAWITTQVAAWQARVWLAEGRLDAASEWAAQRRLNTGEESELLHELDFASLLEYVVLARILIAQAKPDQANRLLPPLLEAAEAGGRTSKSIEILMLQALASQAMGKTAQAMEFLERALSLAEPRGFVGVFVDEGPPMARLLQAAANRGILPDYTAKLLAAFPEAAAPPQTIQTEVPPSSLGRRPSVVRRMPASASPTLVEELSSRELEVLQLIAEGLTNREIATRLFVSLNTVKAHTRNLYGKLGVHSRTRAVARAQELGLLPGK